MKELSRLFLEKYPLNEMTDIEIEIFKKICVFEDFTWYILLGIEMGIIDKDKLKITIEYAKQI